MERSSDLIVALLGILKSGAAYLPLEATAPRERLAAMLADAAPIAVLCDAETAQSHAARHSGTRWQTVASAKYESADPVTFVGGQGKTIPVNLPLAYSPVNYTAQ